MTSRLAAQEQARAPMKRLLLCIFVDVENGPPDLMTNDNGERFADAAEAREFFLDGFDRAERESMWVNAYSDDEAQEIQDWLEDREIPMGGHPDEPTFADEWGGHR